MRRLLCLSSFAALLSLGTMAARADTCNGFTNNLVSNCGFESGTFAGWSGSALSAPAYAAGIDTGDPLTSAPTPYNGNYEAYLGSLGSTIALTQTLSTTVGGLYLVEFALLNDTSPASPYVNSFALLFGGTTLFSESQVNAGPYMLYSFIGSAGTTSTNLSFVSQNGNGTFELDSVSVTATTPEPSSLALLGTGALGLVTTTLRRRRCR